MGLKKYILHISSKLSQNKNIQNGIGNVWGCDDVTRDSK